MSTQIHSDETQIQSDDMRLNSRQVNLMICAIEQYCIFIEGRIPKSTNPDEAKRILNEIEELNEIRVRLVNHYWKLAEQNPYAKR